MERLILGIAVILMATGAPAQCPCDCDGDERVSIGELMSTVRQILRPEGGEFCEQFPGCSAMGACIGALIQCVDASLHGCSDTGSVTPTFSPTFTFTPTFTPSATTVMESRPNFQISSAELRMRGVLIGGCVAAFAPIDLHVCMINGGPGDGAGVLLRVDGEDHGPYEGLFVPGDRQCVAIEGDYSTGIEAGTIVVNPDGRARELFLSDNIYEFAVPVPSAPPLCTPTP